MSENGSPAGAARASITAVVGVLAAVGLLLLLVTWAASIGPQEVLTDDGNPPSYASDIPTVPTPTLFTTGPWAGSQGRGEPGVLLTVFTIVAAVLAAVVILALLLTVVQWLLTRNWRRSGSHPEPEEVAFDPLNAPALLAESMVADARGQREMLASGSPRNAIVACWHRFEEQAAAAGVRRQPWETSSEFTLRVLDRLAADDTAVLRLAELYRDARHSDHEITEANRHSAAQALDAIHRSLGVQAWSS
jgi:hypothetical protein